MGQPAKLPSRGRILQLANGRIGNHTRSMPDLLHVMTSSNEIRGQLGRAGYRPRGSEAVLDVLEVLLL